MSDLEKFEQKNKQHIAQNMWNHMSVGLDGFARLIGFDKKPPTKGIEKNRIKVSEDKYENKIISQRK